MPNGISAAYTLGRAPEKKIWCPTRTAQWHPTRRDSESTWYPGGGALHGQAGRQSIRLSLLARCSGSARGEGGRVGGEGVCEKMQKSKHGSAGAVRVRVRDPAAKCSVRTLQHRVRHRGAQSKKTEHRAKRERHARARRREKGTERTTGLRPTDGQQTADNITACVRQHKALPVWA